MVDASYEDPQLAALYNAINPWGRGEDFWLELVMSAGSVLDVGCGTGRILHRARESGHTGRLCGLDPATGMLDQARVRTDVEWVFGDLGMVGWDREFDLVIMSAHVFQEFLEDDQLRTALVVARSALRDGGRLAFDSVNPLPRPWERWTSEGTCGAVRIAMEVDTPVTGDVVRLTATYSSPGWERPKVDRGGMRFHTPASVTEFLTAAGLRIEERYGDFDRGPLTETSPEIITIARRQEPRVLVHGGEYRLGHPVPEVVVRPSAQGQVEAGERLVHAHAQV